jgi:hypothetical protein
LLADLIFPQSSSPITTSHHAARPPAFFVRQSLIAEKVDDIMDIPDAEGRIDPATFEQILEMDEDDGERDFSKSIVFDFFGQADSTFKNMEAEL